MGILTYILMNTLGINAEDWREMGKGIGKGFAEGVNRDVNVLEAAAIEKIAGNQNLLNAYELGVMIERKRLYKYGILDGDVPKTIQNEINALARLVLDNDNDQ